MNRRVSPSGVVIQMIETDERGNLKVIRSLGTFRNVYHRWKETDGPVCITGEGSIMAVTLSETWLVAYQALHDPSTSDARVVLQHFSALELIYLSQPRFPLFSRACSSPRLRSPTKATSTRNPNINDLP